MKFNEIFRRIHPQPQLQFIIKTTDAKSEFEKLISRLQESFLKRTFAAKTYYNGFTANGKVFIDGQNGERNQWRFSIEISSHEEISVAPEKQLLIYLPFAVPVIITLIAGVKDAAIFYPVAIAMMYFGKYVYMTNALKFIHQLCETIEHKEIICNIEGERHSRISEKLSNFKFKEKTFRDFIKL